MYPKLPDIRQQDWQAEWQNRVSCGEGVLECIWTYFDVKIRPVPVTPIDGVGPDTLEACLWHSGLRVQAGSMTLDDLAYHTKSGRPVICLVTEPEEVGHWVVVQRVKVRYVKRKNGKTAKVRYLKFQCPSLGPVWESAVTFVRRWHDNTHRRGLIYKHWGIAVFKDKVPASA